MPERKYEENEKKFKSVSQSVFNFSSLQSAGDYNQSDTYFLCIL